MECPYCSGDVEFEPYVEYNAETYGRPVVGKTKCCGKGLLVVPVTRCYVRALSEFDERKTDDWGDVLE